MPQLGVDASKLLKALVTPRPIAFITSLNANGVINAAPFSFFNLVSTDPCLISVSIGRREGQRKDTARNILSNKEFVINICPTHFAPILDLASQDYPAEVSEVEIAQLKLKPSIKVTAPRVMGTLAQLECCVQQVVEIENVPVDLILGRVINLHVLKDVIDANGNVDGTRYHPIARWINNNYCHNKL